MANELSNVGLFVPASFTWDINILPEMNVNNPEFKELLIRLYQNINSMCLALNLKDSAYYIEQEFLNGQVFFPNPTDTNQQERQAFRMVVNFGALPNNSTISIPHNIPFTSTYSCTRIYGASSNQIGFNYLPLPYVSTNSANNIQLDVNGTNITITTTADYSAYTTTYVVLEYLKN